MGHRLPMEGRTPSSAPRVAETPQEREVRGDNSPDEGVRGSIPLVSR